MDYIFDLTRTEASIVEELTAMSFSRLAEGHSAVVFGDSDNQIVLKFFPAQSVGAASELAFIKKNPFLSLADRVTLRMEAWPAIKWARQSVKSVIAVTLSRTKREQRKRASEYCIRGYEACIQSGLMTGLPTRVISNCASQLTFRRRAKSMKLLSEPTKIVLQKRFCASQVVLNILRTTSRNERSLEQCLALVRQVVEYQLLLWRKGLVCKDGAFNVFENSILLPGGQLQLHDANDVGDLLESALRFIREKEQDISQIYTQLGKGKYPKLLYDTSFSSVAETARRLYAILPASCRDEIVLYFFDLARKTLREDVLRENWNIDCPAAV